MNSFLDCPTDCDLTLGPVEVYQDCIAYKQRLSQLCGLIILPDEADLPADWTDAQQWALVLDNSITGNEKGRYLAGEGEVDEPEADETNYPKREIRITKRLYTLDFTVKNLSDIQYEFLRQLQCGWKGFRFWYETLGGRLLGGAGGITPFFVDAVIPYDGGRSDKERGEIMIQFESDGDPDRADVSGIGEAVEGASTGYVAFGPVDDGDVVFGPVDDGDVAFGYPE